MRKLLTGFSRELTQRASLACRTLLGVSTYGMKLARAEGEVGLRYSQTRGPASLVEGSGTERAHQRQHPLGWYGQAFTPVPLLVIV